MDTFRDGFDPAMPSWDAGLSAASFETLARSFALGRIDADHKDFNEKLKDAAKDRVRKRIQHGDMIGKHGKDLVSIPVPSIDLPRFKHGVNGGRGVGSGDGKPGTPLDSTGSDGQGGAGTEPGEHIREVDLTHSEIAKLIGEELELPRIKPKGKGLLTQEKLRYTGIRRVGPESLRHYKRTYKNALKRSISEGIYNPDNPIVIPIREDKLYRDGKPVVQRETQGLCVYQLDVSGSVNDEMKEIVRRTAWLIDEWVRDNYKKMDTVYIIHDSNAREVDRDTFYSTKESGGTKISSAYLLGDKILQAPRYPLDEWNIYYFQFTDGDNDSGDNAPALAAAKSLARKCNVFCYAQVGQPTYYGGGFMGYGMATPRQTFYDELEAARGKLGGATNMDNEPLVETILLAKIPDKGSIKNCVKAFLGKGK